MQMTVVALSAVLLAGAFFQPAHAQIQVTLPGYGQAPPPVYSPERRDGQFADQRERCEKLDARARELNQSLARTPPGPARAGLEQNLRETNREQEQCRGR
jgi:hypothetical protein